MAGSLHDSTLEKQYSAFNCDDRKYASDLQNRCDVNNNESEFKWLNYCCFSMMILLTLFILKDRSPLENETSIKNVWKTPQEFPWMIILIVLISAIIGSISIVKENNFMNEQFDDIETNNYSYRELEGLHFEEADFEITALIFMFTSIILVIMFIMMYLILMDETTKSDDVMISKEHKGEWFVDSEKYQSKHVHKKEAKYFNSNEKQLKDKIKQLENSLLYQSKNRENISQKLRNELLQLKADYESLKKSKKEINVNQTVVYNISDSVISGDQSLNNEININSDKEN